jgi:hypothetical protein
MYALAAAAAVKVIHTTRRAHTGAFQNKTTPITAAAQIRRATKPRPLVLAAVMMLARLSNSFSIVSPEGALLPIPRR